MEDYYDDDFINEIISDLEDINKDLEFVEIIDDSRILLSELKQDYLPIIQMRNGKPKLAMAEIKYVPSYLIHIEKNQD